MLEPHRNPEATGDDEQQSGRRGEQPGAEAPATRLVQRGDGRHRRQLPGAPDSLEHAGAEVRGRSHVGGRPQSRGGSTHARDLVRAVGAGAQVPLVGTPLVRVESVQDVGTQQGVHILVDNRFTHASTPKQSRSRTSPSRMRALTVPSGAPSSSATSR